MILRAKESATGIEIESLLTSVFTLCMLDTTLSRAALDSRIQKSRVLAEKRASKLRPRKDEGVNFDVLGHVVYRWQRTATYIDDEGRPLAIKARGAAPSIQALFRDVKKGSYFEDGIKHLLQVKRIKRTTRGRYIPCSEVTIVNGLTPELVKLLSQTMNRLVLTVLHNTSQRNSTKIRFIERITAVPDLPLNQVQAFKVFAREQGGALINTMNEWLESRRGHETARVVSASKNLTAGLHVFAFTERNEK
jgi:hypothetical protein